MKLAYFLAILSSGAKTVADRRRPRSMKAADGHPHRRRVSPSRFVEPGSDGLPAEAAASRRVAVGQSWANPSPVGIPENQGKYRERCCFVGSSAAFHGEPWLISGNWRGIGEDDNRE